MKSEWVAFLDKVIAHCAELERKNCDVIFFRGHSCDTFELTPTLLRNKNENEIEDLETSLYYDFVSMAGTKINMNDSWDILFTMRHYGMPTRVLDWTTNFANALYFSISCKTIDQPHIWILDPFELSKSTPSLPPGLLNPYYDLENNYVDLFVNKAQFPKIFRPEFPIPLYPPRNNPRLFAQQGVFTLHGTINNSIESIAPHCLKKFPIPTTCLADAKLFLVLCGIHEYSIYPDLTGLSNYLKEKHKY